MLITDTTVNSFLHYFSENASVCLMNNHFVDKASKKQAHIWKNLFREDQDGRGIIRMIAALKTYT
nr:hypothetical protein [Providencia rettgeri]